MLEQLLAGGEGEGQHGVVGLDAVGAGGLLVHDEAAADREVDLLPQPLARVGVGGEAHAVRVLGQGDLALEDQVLADDEGDLAGAVELDGARLAHPGDPGVDGVHVHQLGLLAGQAEQDRLVAAVALAGQAERAVQDGLHARDPLQQAVLVQAAHELVRRGHRAARVGSSTGRCRS
ncbi:hypothetical protein GCM10020220_096490 [Nonomuraea rubra]